MQLPKIFDGCKVFPCQPNGKLPATEKGWKEASSDPEQIKRWSELNPRFNWAVACGLSDLFVIDVDPDGLQWWHDKLASDPALREAASQAYTVKTPRGGLHVYFKGQGPTTASRIAPGIDTRGGIIENGEVTSGGYVLLPGSSTPAGTYTPQGGELLSIPGSVKSIVPERKKATTHGLERPPELDQPRNEAWAQNVLEDRVSRGQVSIDGQGGNAMLYETAAAVLDKAISPARCLEMLEEHWNPHCIPPWEPWEMARTIENAAKYGQDTAEGSKGIQSNSDAFKAYENYIPPVTPSTRRTELLWLKEYAEQAEDPRWLIPDTLPAEGVGMLYGASGTYKSFLALDMSLCLAYGHSGQWGAPPVKNPVLFFAGEGPRSTAKKRWPAWVEWQEQQAEDPAMLFMDRVPYLNDTDAWEHVKSELKGRDVKPSLIVIDTLSRLLTGFDENSAKDATEVMGFLENMARHYECFVLVLHHSGKDKSRGARGSSVWEANMDTVLSTRRKENGVELRARKQKDADVDDAIRYFEVKEMGQSIVLSQTETLSEAPKKGTNRLQWAEPAEIVKILSELGQPVSTTILADEIGKRYSVGVDMVRKRIGKIDALNYLHAGSMWSLPEYDL